MHVASILPCLASRCQNLRGARRPARTMHGSHARLLLLKKAVTKVVDLGVTDDRGALTAKTEQGSSTNFCHQAHSSLSMLKTIL